MKIQNRVRVAETSFWNLAAPAIPEDYVSLRETASKMHGDWFAGFERAVGPDVKLERFFRLLLIGTVHRHNHALCETRLFSQFNRKLQQRRDGPNAKRKSGPVPHAPWTRLLFADVATILEFCGVKITRSRGGDEVLRGAFAEAMKCIYDLLPHFLALKTFLDYARFARHPLLKSDYDLRYSKTGIFPYHLQPMRLFK